MRAISTRSPKNGAFQHPSSACRVARMSKIRDYRRKGTQQLRIGLHSSVNRIYHTSTVTRGRLPVFQSLPNGRLLTRAMMRIQIQGHAESLAFVIMPDHLHWLLRLAGDRSLSDCVCAVKSESARAIKRFGTHTSPVWQRGFYDRAIRTEESIVDVARYIIANPVRAGIVDSVRRYSLWDAVWV